MISIKLTLNNPPVCIGYKGENVHTEIRFDAEEIFAEYPSATTSMAVRNHEGTLYPVELTRDGNELIWLVTRSDLVCAGSGRYQITFLQGDEVLKTCIGTTIVRNSLDESEAPDPVAGWIEEADKRLAEAEADIDIVLQYIDTAETNANKSEGFAVGQKDGEDVDSDSPYYQNNAKYYNTQAGMAKDAAVQAKEDAETAEGNANQSKTAAAQSAESAQAAQGAAEEAQRKAETAQEKAEDAQGKAEDAQGTAEEAKRTAVQAAETAGGAAENAEESADAAEQSELKAEGYAVGQQSGTDVGSDSPYYQNNAKYYKEQAALSATQAREYRDASQQIADGIESAGAEQVQAVEDKGQEVLDSIPQDYTDLSNEVSDLNRALNTLNPAVGDHEDRISELENGGYQMSKEYVEAEVDVWLDNHPEATTTVQDESLTLVKFSPYVFNYSVPTINLGKSINTNSSTPILPTNIGNESGWCCICVPCVEGDVFFITGQGGSATRLWAFSNAEGTRLSQSDAGATGNNLKLIAPANASYFAYNSKTSVTYSVEKGIKPNDRITKLEKAVYWVTPQMFGAKADGVNDDSSAIKSAITYSSTYGGGVYFPPGNYKITEKISFGDLNVIVMDSKAKLVAEATVEYMVDISVGGYPTQRPFIKNIRLDGNSKAKNGIFISGISNSGCVDIAGLIVENCIETGIEFSNCQGGLFEGIKANNNGGDGIKIAGCNNAKFVSISALANGGNGIVFNHGLISDSSGACFFYGAHAESNAGYGFYFESGGLYSIYSGWLEGNKNTALYVASDAKCNLYGVKVVHGDSLNWAEIYSDYVTVKDCDIQIGTNAQFEPLIASDYAIIENLCRAVQTGVVATGGTIAEKLFANVIPNGDMQGDQSAGDFNVYYGTEEYQNTDVVEQGKTYSLKSVSTDGNFSIRKDGISGWIVGALYKITFRVYLDGNDCNMRVYATDQTLSNTQYSNATDIKNGQWNEVVGYFYARSSGEIRIGAGMVTISSSAGASFYISELFCQQCVEKNKISNKRIGKNKVYLTIEPQIMQ